MDAGEASDKLRVFISYSRRDGEAAESLRQRLIASDFDAFLDVHDIVKGEAWQDRLRGLIESADAVLFLISPDSVASEICGWEVNEAELRAKRILPVVIRSVDDASVPQRLKRLNYTFLDSPARQESEFPALLAALRQDAEWVREHTRIGELALRWERAGRPERLQLRGADLRAAELWRDRRLPGAPELSPLHVSFLMESRLGEGRRRLLTALGVAGAAFAAFVIIATVSVLEANLTASRLADSRALAAASRSAVDANDPTLGVLLALEALPKSLERADKPFAPEAETALAYAFARYHDFADMAAPKGEITAAAPMGTAAVVLGSSLGRIWVTDAKTGKTKSILYAKGPAVTALDGLADGRVAAGFEDGSIVVFAAVTGAPTKLASDHRSRIDKIGFGPNGASLVSESAFDDKAEEAPPYGVFVHLLGPEPRAVLALSDAKGLAFSADRQRFAARVGGETLQVRSAFDGKPVPGLKSFYSDGDEPIGLSNDGRFLAVAPYPGSAAEILDARTGARKSVTESLAFQTDKAATTTPDGRFAMFASRDGHLEIWRADAVAAKADHKDPDKAWFNSAASELQIKYEQSGKPTLAASTDSSRLAAGLDGGEVALFGGLDTFTGYGDGDLSNAQLRTSRLSDPAEINFLGADRLLLRGGGKAQTLAFEAHGAPLRKLYPPEGAVEFGHDIFAYYRERPEHADFVQLNRGGRLGDGPIVGESADYRAVVSSAGDVFVMAKAGERRVARIDTHGKGVSSLAILPGESEIAVALQNRRLIVADLATGTPLRDFETGMSPIETMMFDPSENELYAFTFEAQVYDQALTLPLPLERCQALLKDAAGAIDRKLNPEEREVYDVRGQASRGLSGAYLALRSAVTAIWPKGAARCPAEG